MSIMDMIGGGAPPPGAGAPPMGPPGAPPRSLQMPEKATAAAYPVDT